MLRLVCMSVPKKSSIEATAFNVVLELLRDIRVLLQHPVYDLLLAGNAIYTGKAAGYVCARDHGYLAWQSLSEQQTTICFLRRLNDLMAVVVSPCWLV